MSDLITQVLRFALVIPAIILHEVAHGYVAYMLGDPTAKERGRLSLNPIAHVDLWGTIIMPFIMVITLGYAFGYAKPVPINPYRMKKVSPETGMLFVGAAGPVTNIILAVVGSGAYRLLATYYGGLSETSLGLFLVMNLIKWFVLINLVLAFFNLIPIPPLDGSRIVQRFLHGRVFEAYAKLEPYGFMIIIAVAFLLPNIGIDPLGAYLRATVAPLQRLLLGA